MSVDDVGSQLTSDTANSRLGDEEPDIAGTQDGPLSGSQPDADAPQPEYLFSKCFKTTRPEVLADITPKNAAYKFFLEI